MTRFVYLTQFNRNYGGEHTVPVVVNPDKIIAIFPVDQTRSKSGEETEKVPTTFIQYSSENEQDYGGFYVIESVNEIVAKFRGHTP